MFPLFIRSLAWEVIGTDNKAQQQYFLHQYINDRAKQPKQWQIEPFQNCSYSSLFHSDSYWHRYAVKFVISIHQGTSTVVIMTFC